MAQPFALTTRALRADDGRHAAWVWAVCGGLLAAWLAWFFLADIAVREVSQQARVEVTQQAHGVAAPVAGSVVANHLTLGRKVRKGEVLLQLDDREQSARLQETDARLTALQPRMHSLQKEMAELTLALKQDELAALARNREAEARLKDATASAQDATRQARRVQEQHQAGFVSDAMAERAKTDATRQAAQRDAIAADQTRLRNEAATHQHDRQGQLEALQREWLALQGEQASLQASRERLQHALRQLTVTAPLDGVIAESPALPEGSYVAEGRSVATIVPSGELRIVSQFMPASALGRIQPGQRASMKLDGFAWTQFGTLPAEVLQVGHEVRDGLVRVELRPLSQNAQVPLQHGLPGVIDIDIERISPAALLLRTVARWATVGAAS
jgi:multidrug resistance efflux pump